MIRTRVSLPCAIVVCVGVATAMAFAQGRQPGPDGRAIAPAYIAGMESGDLGALFRTDGRRSILANASDEGSCEHYRDLHSKPEMEAAKDLRFTIAKESEEDPAEASLVRQTCLFTADANGETRKYRVAVSYVIVSEDDTHRIAHLHWSSRPAQRPTEQP